MASAVEARLKIKFGWLTDNKNSIDKVRNEVIGVPGWLSC